MSEKKPSVVDMIRVSTNHLFQVSRTFLYNGTSSMVQSLSIIVVIIPETQKYTAAVGDSMLSGRLIV